jgi:hypothetical protein
MRTILLVATLALAACGSDAPAAPEPDLTVTGTWAGPLDSDTDFRLVLSEVEGAVSGSGTMTVTGIPGIALQVVSGTHVFPNLSLVLDADGYESFSYLPTVTASFMTGPLQGSGWAGETLILTKQ